MIEQWNEYTSVANAPLLSLTHTNSKNTQCNTEKYLNPSLQINDFLGKWLWHLQERICTILQNYCSITPSENFISDLEHLAKIVKENPKIYRVCYNILNNIQKEVLQESEKYPEIKYAYFKYPESDWRRDIYKNNKALNSRKEIFIKLFSESEQEEAKEMYETLEKIIANYKQYTLVSSKNEKNELADLQKIWWSEGNKAISIYMKRKFQEKADLNFIQSINTVHWTFSLKGLEAILRSDGITNHYDMSTVWYLWCEDYMAQWGNSSHQWGVGIQLTGTVLLAANDDLRTDNRINWDKSRKYPLSDNSAIILNKDSFLTSRERNFWHNEFLITDYKIQNIVIDENIFDSKSLPQLQEIASKYNIEIINSKKEIIK